MLNWQAQSNPQYVTSFSTRASSSGMKASMGVRHAHHLVGEILNIKAKPLVNSALFHQHESGLDLLFGKIDRLGNYLGTRKIKTNTKRIKWNRRLNSQV